MERLYTDLAQLWSSFSPPHHYEAEMALYRSWLEQNGPIGSILELGSGGGHQAHWFPEAWDTTLVDLSDSMLALSRKLNPRHTHVEGDMRRVRLGRTFDAVLLHDAVMYMTSRQDLLAAFVTAAAHLDVGGLFLVLPDVTKDEFEEMNVGGGTDDGELPVRVLEWHWDPDPDDETYQLELAFLVREPDGTVRCHHDQHTLGLFPHQVWLDLLSDAGFDLVAMEAIDTREMGVAFLARKG